MLVLTAALALSAAAAPTRDEIRKAFPALARQEPWALLENAGGSQLPAPVIDAMSAYLVDSYVQTDAGYPASDVATEIVANAFDVMAAFANAPAPEWTTVIGPSTSALVTTLATAFGQVLDADAEIIVAESNHEANYAPWVRLPFKTVRWEVDPATMQLDLAVLRDRLLSSRTRIVAIPQTSNIFGDILDVAEVARIVHSVEGAVLVVDGVGFAPHRLVDVQALGADFYVLSNYKVFGPHAGTLYGRSDLFAALPQPNWDFTTGGKAWQPGGPTHESCAGIGALADYLAFLADEPVAQFNRSTVEAAFALIEELETELVQPMMDYLLAHPAIQVIGPQGSAAADRVAIFSFVADSVGPIELVERLQAANLAVRYGCMYSDRICSSLGLDMTEGVVRISALHYNSMSDIERVIEALEEALR